MELISNKKINKPSIYLISPTSIDNKFFPSLLKSILSTGLISVFQLRIKKYSDRETIQIIENLFPICINYKVPFILNDRADIAKITGVDGVHLGEEDISIKKARNILGNNKIIGSSCYNSIKLSIKSSYLGADYNAFGSFFNTNTKKNTKAVSLVNLRKFKKFTNKPTVGIGGLNMYNIKKIAFLKLDFLAFCSSIWYNKKSPLEEVKKIKKIIDSFL
ncbi:thiamine phosphate synthase [Alphaproteobacteria bacterium]|nr:thiamine phosphate synthase [Alphaproteobacteria bacterium]